MKQKHSFYISTLGCPKNTVDSENMAALLCEAGFIQAFDPSRADLLLVNTCSFIEDAKEESVDEIFALAQFKEKTQAKLIVTGCLAQRYGKELFTQLPEADGFVGTGEFYDIARYAAEVLRGKRVLALSHLDHPIVECDRVLSTPAHYAYIKLSEGCNKRCSYCAIPSFRGPMRSRTMENIVSEVQRLRDQGVKEFILISQDDGEYGVDLYHKRMLPALLEMLEQVEGDVWFRMLYLYPETITDALIDAVSHSKKIAPYFDIPIQHIHDGILSAMHRHTTKQDILTLIDKLRNRIPGCAIRTSLIVGFPGETKEAFLELADFLEEKQLDRVGVFAYSKEEATPAARLKGQIPRRTKMARRDRLMRMQEEISASLLQKRVGNIERVLIDEDAEECYVARSMLEAPEIDGEIYVYSDRALAVGSFVTVRIVSASEHDLIAEVEK